MVHGGVTSIVARSGGTAIVAYRGVASNVVNSEDTLIAANSGVTSNCGQKWGNLQLLSIGG